MLRTRFYKFGILWEITHELSQQELSLPHATHLSHDIYNLTKLHSNSKGIGVMGCTRFCLQIDGQTDGRTDRRTDRQKDVNTTAIYPKTIGQGIS